MSRCIISSCTFDHDAVNPDYATRRPPGFRKGDHWPGAIGATLRRHLEVIDLLAEFRSAHAVPATPGVIGRVALTDFTARSLVSQRLWAESDARFTASTEAERSRDHVGMRLGVSQLLRLCA